MQMLTSRPFRPAVLTALSMSLLIQTATAFDFSSLEKSVSERTLKNGLKVIVMERHDAPVASFVTWSNVGSVDDPKGYTGLAHMFEHMAFKGTTTLGTKDIRKELQLIKAEDSIFMQLRAERNRGRAADSAKIDALTKAYDAAREASFGQVVPNEFGNVVEREGGVGMNAFTANDATVYFFSLPSNKVELWMALESERFLNPVLREMYKERDVVAEERRMRTESNPIGRLVEEMLALAFKAHPYGVSGIGHMSDIQYYSRLEADAFFKKYYGPSNLTIVVVGDVVPEEVFKLAAKYWERIPYRPAPERIATTEPEQLGERRMVIEDPAQPLYAAGWKIPDITNPDRPAIDAMLDYLGGGRTSLLYKNLVKEKKMAFQVGAFSGFPGNKYPSLSLVYAFPAKGKTSMECEKEIFAEIERLQTTLLTDAEIAEIKTRARAAFINNMNSNSNIGLQLGEHQQLWGDWRETFRNLDRINTVTAADIQRVAKTYFIPKNRTVVMSTTSQS